MLDLQEKQINGPVIRLHDADNVLVARTEVQPGTSLPESGGVAGTVSTT